MTHALTADAPRSGRYDAIAESSMKRWTAGIARSASSSIICGLVWATMPGRAKARPLHRRGSGGGGEVFLDHRDEHLLGHVTDDAVDGLAVLEEDETRDTGHV